MLLMMILTLILYQPMEMRRLHKETARAVIKEHMHDLGGDIDTCEVNRLDKVCFLIGQVIKLSEVPKKHEIISKLEMDGKPMEDIISCVLREATDILTGLDSDNQWDDDYLKLVDNIPDNGIKSAVLNVYNFALLHGNICE